MQVVIESSGKILATHADWQDISQNYPGKTVLQLTVEQYDAALIAVPSLSRTELLRRGLQEQRLDLGKLPAKKDAQWSNFNTALLSDVDFLAATQLVPTVITSALITAFSQYTGNPTSFESIYATFTNQAKVSSKAKSRWADLAKKLDLPADFVQILHH